jgi:class 3 adenylate cyclase
VDAERRQITILFTDMVGFTTFSERSGEEAAFTLMRSLAKLMDDAVREQGGVTQAFTGDGISAPPAANTTSPRPRMNSHEISSPNITHCLTVREFWLPVLIS